MQGLIAQVGESSARVVGSIVASRLWELASDSHSESTFASVGYYLEPAIGRYVGEVNQWDLLTETASANASPSIVLYQIDIVLFRYLREEHSPWCEIFAKYSRETFSTVQRTSLTDIFHIDDSAAIADFLTRNAFLNDLLIEAHNKIVEFFGENVDVHLALYDDPDSGDGQKLYAVIITPLAAKDAIPLQERLDEGWWLENLARAQGKFNIIVEYV